MYGCMDGWMYGWMDVWMYGCYFQKMYELSWKEACVIIFSTVGLVNIDNLLSFMTYGDIENLLLPKENLLFPNS